MWLVYITKNPFVHTYFSKFSKYIFKQITVYFSNWFIISTSNLKYESWNLEKKILENFQGSNTIASICVFVLCSHIWFNGGKFIHPTKLDVEKCLMVCLINYREELITQLSNGLSLWKLENWIHSTFYFCEKVHYYLVGIWVKHNFYILDMYL